MSGLAPFLRIVARGPTLSRSLTAEEAEAAMDIILDGGAAPEQLGAFLLVLRNRGETVEELAGMVRAARARLAIAALPAVDLDWPSYADAHRQLPYFLLAARLLADAGVRVLMHGGAGAGPATTRHGLSALGLASARTASEAAEQLETSRLAYLPLELLHGRLAELFALRPILGVRTGINSVARELNPGGAAAMLQGVFHPPYIPLHVGAQRMLGQPRALTFKGGGGEGQRNPDKPCRAVALVAGEEHEIVWPRLTDGGPWPWRGEPLEPSRLAALWRGDWEAPGPVAAVIGTAAMALWLTGRAADPAAADRLAAELWARRDRLRPQPLAA